MNTTWNTTGYKSYWADATLLEGQRVKFSAPAAAGEGAPRVNLAAATDASLGVATHNAAAGTLVTVKLWTARGTFLLRADAPIAAGARLYPTAGGGFDDAGTTPLGLVALESATGAGHLFEGAISQVGA